MFFFAGSTFCTKSVKVFRVFKLNTIQKKTGTLYGKGRRRPRHNTEKEKDLDIIRKKKKKTWTLYKRRRRPGHYTKEEEDLDTTRKKKKKTCRVLTDTSRVHVLTIGREKCPYLPPTHP